MTVDAALADWQGGSDAARWHADGSGPDELQPSPTEQIARMIDVLSAFGLSYVRAAAPMVEAFNEVGRAALASQHAFAIDVAKAFGIRPSLLGCDHDYPRQSRCRRCNPAGNPLPLAVDGAAYRRRQRNRRRR